jgi:hypothetical protein
MHTKRLSFLACAVTAACWLVSVFPATAAVTRGTVQLPADAPNVQRLGYVTKTLPNGAFGYVVPVDPGATNHQYSLKLDSGATGTEDLDVFFYYSLDGMGDPCPLARDRAQHGDTETGTVCPNNDQRKARYAVVVLNAGAMARFSLSL